MVWVGREELLLEEGKKSFRKKCTVICQAAHIRLWAYVSSDAGRQNTLDPPICSLFSSHIHSLFKRQRTHNQPLVSYVLSWSVILGYQRKRSRRFFWLSSHWQAHALPAFQI